METNQAIIHFLTAASFSRTILIMVIKWKYRYVLCHWVPYLDLSADIMRSSINRRNRVTAIETKVERGDRTVSDGDFTCMATRREMHFTIHVF